MSILAIASVAVVALVGGAVVYKNYAAKAAAKVSAAKAAVQSVVADVKKI
jgi:hypothetical protein